jgi:hypothetical protein
MKRYLVILALFFCSVSVHAQSLTLYDLINLSNLSNDQAYSFFTAGKTFKRLYEQDVNGLSLIHYQTKNPTKIEEVVIGDGVRSGNGTLLRKVNYGTSHIDYVLKMIGQAKGAGLDVNFQGSDATKNIYLFDNFLYTVHIYIATDNSLATVEIQQKDFIDHE